MKVYFEQIYEHIGYLFYAIACEPEKMTRATFDDLKKLVDQQWRPVDASFTLESNLVKYLQSAMLTAFENDIRRGLTVKKVVGYPPS